MSSPRFRAPNFGSKLSIPPDYDRGADQGEPACPESCVGLRRAARRNRRLPGKSFELVRLRSTKFETNLEQRIRGLRRDRLGSMEKADRHPRSPGRFSA